MITHKKNKLITDWFAWYARKALRKNFRRGSLTASSRVPVFEPGVPVIALLNHPSWWDALFAVYLSRYVLRKDFFGVFAEEELERYGIFRSIGCYSVRRGSSKDTWKFLRYTKEILRRDPHLLWIFPQGDIYSSDRLPLEFKPGFAHVAAQFPEVQILKIVVSYDFWLDQKPEIVADFMPLETLRPRKGRDFIKGLTRRVEGQMSERAAEVRRIVKEKDLPALKPLWTAQHGTNPVYDVYRKLKFMLKGREFTKDHSRV